MHVRDAKKWAADKKANVDPYSAAILKYAEEWANTMELRLSKGEKLPSIAKKCEPRGHGITGFMFGAAVATLVAHWDYGEELRRWHNAEYGQPNAKGTINPALVTVSVPK